MKVGQYISSVSKRGQTVIPVQLRLSLGLQEGDHLVWEIQGNENNVKVKKLTLKEEDGELSLSEEEWKKLDNLIREQEREGKHKTYPSVKAAKAHLRRPVKGGG